MDMFYQPDVEQLLDRRIAASPRVTVHRGRELVSLQQHDDHVSLEFGATDDPQDKISASARYVLGADGARSTTRELLGISQTDLGFEYDWLVVDVIPNEERVWKPYVVQHCDPARPSTLVASGPGRRRWEFMRLPGESIEELNTTAKAWELLAPWNVTPDNATVERHAVYTFRGSWADQWKQGRVFLAGDAAHLMPPFLGQGLCSGMRDALAFCWRAEAVLRKERRKRCSIRYGPERSVHVQEIIAQAVEMGRLDLHARSRRSCGARRKHESGDARSRAGAEAAAGAPARRRRRLSGEPTRHAGYLSVQGRVRHGGQEGLFDDVVGKGWQLLVRGNGLTTAIDDSVHESIRRLGGVAVDFGPHGGTVDIDGTYASWFDRLGAEAVLVRPTSISSAPRPLLGLKSLLAAAEELLGTRTV